MDSQRPVPLVCDDDLLDWALGLLEPARREQVEAALARSPELRERADAVHRTLSVLDKLKVAPPDDDLAERIRQQVAAVRNASDRPGTSVPGTEPDSSDRRVRPSLFSLVEIGAAAAAILLLTLVFVPGAMRVNAMKDRLACQSNMQHIGVGLESYATANARMLPFPHLPAQGNWLARDHGRAPSGTAPLFILVRVGVVQPNSLLCPATPDQGFSGSCGDLADFPEPSFCSYSFQNLHGAAGPIMHDPARGVPVLADRNPVFRDGRFRNDVSGNTNSWNHKREGQNVLFTDGRVRWVDSPQVEGDNIWLSGSTRVYTGTERCQGPNDWFFAP